jgi:hypothetical protein
MGNMFQHRITEGTGKISVGIWHPSPIGLGQKLIHMTARRFMEGLSMDPDPHFFDRIRLAKCPSPQPMSSVGIKLILKTLLLPLEVRHENMANL